MSVLNTIKGKIVNVQQDISESLRSLTKSNSRSKSVDSTEIPFATSDAANELLSRYQNLWMQMHQTSEDLSQRAQFVSGLITNIFRYVDQQHAAVNQFASEMTGLHQLVSDVNTAKDKITSLEGAFSELELLLVELDDIRDQRHQAQRQLEHENELKRYRQSKNNELEQMKAELAKAHADKVQKFEERLNVKLQERQKVFDEAFREQMNKYVTTGQFDYVPSPSILSSDLAEIELEQDQDELDKFLSSVDSSELLSNKTIGLDVESDIEEEPENVIVLRDEDCSILSDAAAAIDHELSTEKSKAAS